MTSLTVEVNTPVTLTVKGLASGQPVPADLVLMKNGASDSTAITFADTGIQALYNFTFTPITTGIYTLHAYGAIQGTVEVVTQSMYTALRNLQDESLGSWVWDKTAGTLTMLRQDGTTLASFAVVDNLTTSSRERTS